MDDRYAEDEYRSSYPDGEYQSGQYAAYDSGQYYADDQQPSQYTEHDAYNPYDPEYADEAPAYGYDDTPPVTSPEPARQEPKIEVVDPDGVRAVEIGTLAWLVGFVALLPFWSPLRSHGDTWWIWTCLAGFGLGAIGIELTRRRRAHRIASER